MCPDFEAYEIKKLVKAKSVGRGGRAGGRAATGSIIDARNQAEQERVAASNFPKSGKVSSNALKSSKAASVPATSPTLSNHGKKKVGGGVISDRGGDPRPCQREGGGGGGGARGGSAPKSGPRFLKTMAKFQRRSVVGISDGSGGTVGQVVMPHKAAYKQQPVWSIYKASVNANYGGGGGLGAPDVAKAAPNYDAELAVAEPHHRMVRAVVQPGQTGETNKRQKVGGEYGERHDDASHHTPATATSYRPGDREDYMMRGVVPPQMDPAVQEHQHIMGVVLQAKRFADSGAFAQSPEHASDASLAFAASTAASLHCFDNTWESSAGSKFGLLHKNLNWYNQTWPGYVKNVNPGKNDFARAAIHKMEWEHNRVLYNHHLAHGGKAGLARDAHGTGKAASDRDHNILRGQQEGTGMVRGRDGKILVSKDELSAFLCQPDSMSFDLSMMSTSHSKDCGKVMRELEKAQRRERVAMLQAWVEHASEAGQDNPSVNMFATELLDLLFQENNADFNNLQWERALDGAKDAATMVRPAPDVLTMAKHRSLMNRVSLQSARILMDYTYPADDAAKFGLVR